MVAEKSGSLPSASASSFSVSSAAGELFTSALTAACTNAVVAIWVERVVCAAVGAVGIPESAGECFAHTVYAGLTL